MESGADNWEHKTYIPIYEDATWTENGEPIRRQGLFLVYLVDRMISFIDGELGDGAPFSLTCLFKPFIFPCKPLRNTAPTKSLPRGWHGFARRAMKRHGFRYCPSRRFPPRNEQHR